MDAKKKTLKLEDALEMLKEIDHVYAAKGERVVHLDMKVAKPSEAELAAVLLGPTGNLRAPALKKGRTLIVGFEEGMYGTLFR